ncbi:hypothetical protein PVK06_019925 [Gossypium arboreum]|uniref:Uncharacterized protein n=1 Tax=Gossypium arboreum TaxID=29729 RepID=A0ABR0PL14_GOSAR|nr:hypothetical protein PVK06_019925 [Gossypium arboreum]
MKEKDGCSTISKAEEQGKGPSEMIDLEWVIQWIQLMIPLGIDYAQSFSIPMLEPPQNRYPPMQLFRQADEEWKEEEDDDDEEEEEEPAHDKEFNEMF